MQDVRHDGSIPGACPWFDRYIVPGSRCLLAPGNGFFLRLAVPPMGGGTVCTYRGCGYRVPAWKRPGALTVRSGPADAENGPGSRSRQGGAAGERQALKLMGYINHVGGKRPPLRGGSCRGSGPGGASRPYGPPDLRVSRLRAALAGRARLQGPSRAHEPPPDRADNHCRKHERKTENRSAPGPNSKTPSQRKPGRAVGRDALAACPLELAPPGPAKRERCPTRTNVLDRRTA